MQKQNNQSLRSNNLKRNLSLKNIALPFVPNFKDERTQKFTTIVLTVITLSFFGVFAINPTVSTILKLRKELEDNKFVDNQLTEKIQNISTLQKKYLTLQNDLPFVLSAVPKNSEVPLLAAQIQAIAKNSNVSIVDYQTFEVEIPQKANKQGYLSFSFALSAEGSYNDLHKFITSLSNMQRVVSFELLSLTKKTGSSFLQMAVKGRGFFSP